MGKVLRHSSFLSKLCVWFLIWPDPVVSGQCPAKSDIGIRNHSTPSILHADTDGLYTLLQCRDCRPEEHNCPYKDSFEPCDKHLGGEMSGILGSAWLCGSD